MTKTLDKWLGHCFVAKNLRGEMHAWRRCPRCSGRGEIPRFGYIHKGICFQCEGGKFVYLPKVAERIVLRHSEFIELA